MLNKNTFNSHEYLAYYLCNDLYGFHPLNEEKGRIPQIEAILNEIETVVTENIDEGESKTMRFPFIPKISTFFDCINFNLELTITKEDNVDIFYKDEASGAFDAGSVLWFNNKIASFNIKATISCPKSRFSFNFRRTIGHELLHAYELYKRAANGIPNNTIKGRNLYNKIVNLMDSGKEPQQTLARLFYLNYPKELNAYSQAIQNEYADVVQRISYKFLQLPYNYLKANIVEYLQLETVKDGIKYIVYMHNDQEIIQALSEVLGRPIMNIIQAKKIIKSAILNIEQTFDKALSRAIETYAAKTQNTLATPQTLGTIEKTKNTLKEIKEHYGVPSNIKQ